MRIKLGVIFGGDSVEHEISVITALQAMENLDNTKYDIVPIYIAKDRTWYTGKMLMDIDVYKDFENLKKFAKKVILTNVEGMFILRKVDGIFKKNIENIDIAFPMVHGKGVEDGSLSGYLETIGVPFVGPSVLGASLGQDKVVMKQIMKEENIPVVKYTWFYDTEYLNDSSKIIKEISALGYPVIVKPARLGSSIGIKLSKTELELDKAISEAIKYDDKIVVEKVIENLLEVNCSVTGNAEYQETSFIDEVLTKNEFLTFDDKYTSGAKGKLGKLKTSNSGKMSSADRVIPARISVEVEQKVIDLAKKTFRALNLSGIARIDFLINKKTSEVYVNEPNTIPGSLSFYLWEPAGKKYNDLLDEAITLAIKDYKNKSKKISSFETNVLTNFSGVKGLKGLKGKR